MFNLLTGIASLILFGIVVYLQIVEQQFFGLM